MKRETIDINFMISILIFSLVVSMVILEITQTYREVKKQEHYKTGFCEAKGGRLIQNQCVDKKYIFN